MRQGPRIYNLFPILAGPIERWESHLERIAEMGFDWIFVNPFHEAGFSGSLYAVKNYYALDPRVRGESRRSDDDVLAAFVASAGRHGLAVMMDLVINHTAKDSLLAERKPSWFCHNADGSLRSPGAVDPTDPSVFTEWGDLAEIDYAVRPERAEIVGYFGDVIDHYLKLGFRGFRGDAAYKVPAEVWHDLILGARARRSDVVFFAETLGCRPNEVTALHDAGFDFIFNSSKWWDFKAPWLLEQYETFRHIAPSISFPETHDTERLSADLAREGVTDPRRVEEVYRQRYLFSAAFSAGVMMPMGYEFGFKKRLDVVKTQPSDWETPAFDISDYVAEVNRIKARAAVMNEEGPQTRLASDDPQIMALRRSDEAASAWLMSIVNTDRRHARTVTARALVDAAHLGCGREVTPGHQHGRLDEHTILRLHPSEIRLFLCQPAEREAATPEREPSATPTLPVVDAMAQRLRSKRIVIQNVRPSVDCGRFPVKREVGETLDVSAEIFKEGHDKIAAVVRYRRQGDAIWHEQAMEQVNAGLDLWRASIRLEENTRYIYTVTARGDSYATWIDEVGKKRQAGQSISLELLEGHHLVQAAHHRASVKDRERLALILAEFDRADDPDLRFATLTAPLTQRLMERWPDREGAVGFDPEHEVVVDRVAARFAAWYEMFPRSQGRDPHRSATFHECIARLDEIRAMGFDVVYLVPIHPIGRTHRKGRNNTLGAGRDDPGSPYAIGSEAGGHDAIHPDLGTLDDFREFVAAARQRGMEIALDFAIQCSPDHPWLKQHPDWFEYRPDGTIKYAENPPKKYQDIVNVNFFGGHQEELWQALRDVVLFWVGQGVRIFRVDNPHTKPVPFWEWLIGSVQRAHPDVIFLAEAFTRPAVLRMMAKVGFGQSYTYFTWRNFKGELTEYFEELSQSECVEYLRPNLFVNTPDILPKYLQSGGRPAFQIRLVLAATLSPVYGIYNGFELCEAAAIPDSEEYLNSEKYEYKVWDWDRPGNIKDYIAAVNRARRDNRALQFLRNLRFYHASDGNVLFYGKMTPSRDNVVLVAVNLDPFDTHEAELRLPLEEMGIGEDRSFRVEELLSGEQHLWRGAIHRIRLDPRHNPAAIFRVAAWEHVDFHDLGH